MPLEECVIDVGDEFMIQICLAEQGKFCGNGRKRSKTGLPVKTGETEDCLSSG